ncbi:MAG TPA: hypothetical protein VEX36_08860 [Thermoleophilaceae bacterium]|nr:hypothetical protein [Thermoleophilaceae bacterium]
MDGGDVVTVVSVIVAGALSPWIAGQIASRAQGKRFDHERALHDLDDLRRELDRLGDAFGDFIRAVTSFLSASDDETRLTRRIEARRHGSVAMERTARLKVRLPEDDLVVMAARKVLDQLDGVVSDADDLTDDEIDARMSGVGDAHTEFFRAANRQVGARIPAW